MTATTIQQRLSRIRKVLRKAPEKRKYRWAWGKAENANEQRCERAQVGRCRGGQA